MSTQRLHKASKRRRQVYLKKLALALITLVMVACLSISLGAGFADAHEEKDASTCVTQKYYKSIEITAGDSLWNIAEEYMTEEYDSIYDYINEVKEINSLISNDIHEGQYLTIAYYDAI